MIYISGGHYYKVAQAPNELSALLPIIGGFRALWQPCGVSVEKRCVHCSDGIKKIGESLKGCLLNTDI